MPPIFKALATIAAWTLFVSAWLWGVIPLIMGTIAGDLFVIGVTPPLFYPAIWGVALLSMIASVVAMKLRHMLE